MGYAASMRSSRQAEVGGAVDWGERRGGGRESRLALGSAQAALGSRRRGTASRWESSYIIRRL